MTNVAKSEEYIDSCSNLLIERLGQFAKSGKPCDLGEWLHWYFLLTLPSNGNYLLKKEQVYF
jgi:hypothetical protein